MKQSARSVAYCATLATAVLCALLIGSGCASTEVSSSVGIVEGFKTDPVAESKVAILRSGVLFSVDVEVDGESEIQVESLRVRETGEAVLPLIGSVKLNGLTLTQATDLLATLYKPYYISQPIVRLQFVEDESGKSAPWGYVTVLGRVRKPGRVNLPPTRDMTVSSAIQGADGFDTSANLAAVRITRTGEDLVKTSMIVDMNRIGGDGDTDQDIRLRSGDVVYVPERIF